MNSFINNHFKNHWRSLAGFFALIITIQVLGNLTTMPNIPTWYAGLDRAPWSPPNFVFGPVWTALYIMLALVGWQLWVAAPGTAAAEKSRSPALRFFFVQLLLNALWSPLFFGLHLTGTSFIVLLLIIVFTVLTMVRAAKINRILSWCLLPYLAWLCYAASLNLYIAVYN